METQKRTSRMKFILPLYYILWCFLKLVNVVQKNIHVSTKIIHDACINNPKGSTYLSIYNCSKILYILYYIIYLL